MPLTAVAIRVPWASYSGDSARPAAHRSSNLLRQHLRLWWLLSEPGGPGYRASGRGGQSITVLPKSRAVIVYMATVRPDREITPADIGLLDNVFVAAFR